MFRRFINKSTDLLFHVSSKYSGYNSYKQYKQHYPTVTIITGNEHHSRSKYFLLCPGIIDLLNDDQKENANDNNSNNIPIINSNNYKRQRNYDSTFLNHSKPQNNESDDLSIIESPKPKKRKCGARRGLTGTQKAQIIRYSRLNPTATARDIKKHFSSLKHHSDRVIQRVKKDADKMKEDDINKLEIDGRQKQRARVGRFPTIEAELLRRREERVKLNRDRSKHWMKRETESILNDKDCLNNLELNEYEKENIDKFRGSEGYVNKVMARNELSTRSVHSDRKLTVEKYISIRLSYLPNERRLWHELGIIKDGKPEKGYVCNADEVPGFITKLRKK